MSFEKISYLKHDPEYDHEDVYQELSTFDLRRKRIANVAVGFALGVGATLATQYFLLWITGVL